MMTNVLLADYPDVFKAGAAFMGVPYHCFYTGTVDGWNSQCANGQVSMTAQQWGDLAHSADPGYNNFGQEILQWTNVLGVSSTPTTTSTPQPGWTETTYGGSGTVPRSKESASRASATCSRSREREWRPTRSASSA